ncbi:hypothetical protein [Pseudonocardia sp. ICBG1142]|uniref:hypothetical protein n=1 Tax=Pseudonocardia sp. ICBG1142 TaxID=2846760 RepID=UPI001CF61419|nr:hypothetical protein [Pseudonocardia sp. ICBG1142]
MTEPISKGAPASAGPSPAVVTEPGGGDRGRRDLGDGERPVAVVSARRGADPLGQGRVAGGLRAEPPVLRAGDGADEHRQHGDDGGDSGNGPGAVPGPGGRRGGGGGGHRGSPHRCAARTVTSSGTTRAAGTS